MENKLYRNSGIPTSNRLDPASLELLRICYAFRTLDGHAKFFISQKNNKKLDSAVLIKCLKKLIENGYLIDQESFTSKVFKNLESIDTTTPTKIELVGIPTMDRTLELKRLLESLLENLNTFGRMPEIVVVDDSNPDNFKVNAQLLEEVKGKYSGKIVHLDRNARISMAEKITSSTRVPKDVVNYALCPDTQNGRINEYGAVRNFLVLYAAGRKMLMLDDDTIVKIHKPIEPENKLRISSSFQDGYSYFDSNKEAVEYFPTEQVDYLGEHEKWLGQSVTNILGTFGQNAISYEALPAGLNNGLFASIQNLKTNQAKILLTHTGSIGDSWSRYHSNFDASKKRLHDLFGTSEAEFKRNATTPFVSRMDDSHVLYKGPTCISLNVGMDTSELLPPFPPLFRGEDNLFGWMVNRLSNNIFALRSPFAVEHVRKETRPRDTDPFAYLLSVVGLTRILLDMCSPADTSVGDMSENLKQTGEALIELSKAPIEELEIILRSQIANNISNTCNFANHMRAYYADTAPMWWVENMIELAGSANKNISRLSNMPLFSEDPNMDFKKWIENIGLLLKHWPEIRRGVLL